MIAQPRPFPARHPETGQSRRHSCSHLQMARASGVQSSTFRMEVDKQIAEAVVDDDQKLKEIVSEIESQTEVGQFTASQVMQNMEENNEQ